MHDMLQYSCWNNARSSADELSCSGLIRVQALWLCMSKMFLCVAARTSALGMGSFIIVVGFFFPFVLLSDASHPIPFILLSHQPLDNISVTKLYGRWVKHLVRAYPLVRLNIGNLPLQPTFFKRTLFFFSLKHPDCLLISEKLEETQPNKNK